MNPYFVLGMVIMGGVIIVSSTLLLLITDGVFNKHPRFMKFVIIFTAVIWAIASMYPMLPSITIFLWYKYLLTGIVIAFYLPHKVN